MHYPGFAFPHAPVYPMDYRRMFEPRFHAPSWGDVPRQHHYSQPQGRREMSSSEVQTDPSDAITKLIECLDKIRDGELQGADRELDSGVASQSSGMISPGEERKNEEQGNLLASVPHDSHLESTAVTFSDSTAAVYDGESSQRSLDVLSPEVCWSGGLGEDLPLDSSSVHEECHESKHPAANEHFFPLEKEEVTDIQSEIPVTNHSLPKCDSEEPLKATLAPSHQELKETKTSSKVSKAEHSLFEGGKQDQGYQILKLPFDSVLTPGAGCISPPAAPYYYNCLSMQMTGERISVLSPSLDELSSRDEMFSTDLDDVDFFPRQVYAGRRLTEVKGGSPEAPGEDVWQSGSKRFMCACCGKSLGKGTGSKSKAHSSKMYRDDAGESEEESRYVRGCEQSVRVVVRKHPAARKPQPLPQRHPAKPWYKRSPYKEPSDPVAREDLHDVCKQEPAEGDTGDGSELQCRTCEDRLCREDLTTSDQARWADADVIPRRRQTTPLQRQEMNPQWKALYHRPRDNRDDDDDDEPHWERGSAIRGEQRC
ncbi:bucky ball-like isoform X2 [Mugil cephalus]|nr:bucky ball-like isoform X2 [Mugil cephalus]